MDEKISKLFLPLLDKLYYTEPAGEPFRQPVDPIKYGCIDYYLYVKSPIDLTTIKNKLVKNQYKDAWRFVADIQIMFSNAYLFNKRGTPVYEFTNKLNKIWNQELTPIMQRLNYCCGTLHKFGPQLLFCLGTAPERYCQIAIGAKYKCYQDSYSFCMPCFNKIETEHINIQALTCETSRMNLPQQPVKKSDFVDCTNDHWQYEAFVKCVECSRRIHQICDLHPAAEDELVQCEQHDEIEQKQRALCKVPPQFLQFSQPGTVDIPKEEIIELYQDDDSSYSQNSSNASDEQHNQQRENQHAGDQLRGGLSKDSSQYQDASGTIETSSNATNILSNISSIKEEAADLDDELLRLAQDVDDSNLDNIRPCSPQKGFVCNHCYRKKRLGFNYRHRKYSARRLPHTRMSRYIETKVNEHIRENSPTAGEVTIRVLTAYRDKAEVKPEMREYVKRCKAKDTTSNTNIEDYPDEFEYTNRAIFAWQEIDGVDVCVFGMHVQEYGEDCPEPNRQVVYLSYLDSVHFFRPKQVRTAVYHEILLSYFKYVKKLGFRRVFIWVCPSRKGDDYIFYRHPSEQRMPTLKRLSDWYIHLLDKGLRSGIVYGHQTIYDYAMSENWNSLLSMPYLGGDYWPGEFERLLKLMIESKKKYDERMEQLRQRSQESSDGAYELEHQINNRTYDIALYGTGHKQSNNETLSQADHSLEQHNILALSSLYQRHPITVPNNDELSDIKDSLLNTIGLKPTVNTLTSTNILDTGASITLNASMNTEDCRYFNEPFTPSSSKSDEQPLDLSKSSSNASPESNYDDDNIIEASQTEAGEKSRRKRRKSSSTMGYTKKRKGNIFTQPGKTRASQLSAESANKCGKSPKTVRQRGSHKDAHNSETPMHPEEELIKNLERSLKRQKEGFIVVRLSECDCSPHFESQRRKEETTFSCDLMKGREPFLQLARLKKYEFSTLRRAKFSSLAMVKHLGQSFKLDPICNECFSFDSSKRHYACSSCEDYYLCTSCHENTQHAHTMTLMTPTTLPDIDEFLQQCSLTSATNSISSASSTISNKSFNEASLEIPTQSFASPISKADVPSSPSPPASRHTNAKINIPLHRHLSNTTGSMPLGCKRQRKQEEPLPRNSRTTEDVENSKIHPFASGAAKLNLPNQSSPPPSHQSSNSSRLVHVELDQVLIENFIQHTELTYSIDFDEMKSESKRLLTHYWSCSAKDTCSRCKFVILSCSFMSVLMRSTRMQMMINCNPNEGGVPTTGSSGSSN